jgi:phage terminase small subunit
MTPKQLKFARLVFEHGNATQAYKQSYSVDNMKETTIGNAASELLQNPEIVAYLQEMKDDAAYVAQLNVAWILKRYMMIATADPNELIESRNVCCRYCHGIDHNYQWVDEKEWIDELTAVLAFNADIENLSSSKRPPFRPVPTSDGGFGFWGTNGPHSECPKCFGKGTLDIHVHDSRKLKGSAKLLYAGIKTTASGVEVKMRDQDGALAKLAEFMGLTGKGANPLQQLPGEKEVPQLTNLTTDPNEAAKTYAAIMAGK